MINQDAYHTLPWVEKYRPTKLDNILLHEHFHYALKKFIVNKNFPHLLFHGPPGTGKTSTIMACANELYGDKTSIMVLELNASDERGIDVVRTRIKQFVKSKNVFYDDDNVNMFKLVILDEIDAMTHEAQAILRKIVEKYITNARFCMICNFIQKISSALQSRCICFRFGPLKRQYIIDKINEITIHEKISIDDSGINTIIAKSGGDMRKVINILQSTSMTNKHINGENINICFGFPQFTYVIELFVSLINDSFDKNYYKLKDYIKMGFTINDLINDFHTIILNYLTDENYDISLFKDIQKLSDTTLMRIFKEFRNIEYNLSVCSSDHIQINTVIASFKIND
jgi:replication factor C subunit 3/5